MWGHKHTYPVKRRKNTHAVVIIVDEMVHLQIQHLLCPVFSSCIKKLPKLGGFYSAFFFIENYIINIINTLCIINYIIHNNLPYCAGYILKLDGVL